MTIKDLAEIYFVSVEMRGVRDVTVTKYQWELSHFLERFGEREVEEVTFPELVKWLRNLRQPDGSRYAHASLGSMSKGIRSFYSFLHENNYIAENLTARLPRYSQSPAHRIAAQENDIIAILNSLDSFVEHRGGNLRDLRDALIVSFSISTGARRRTITELERKEVEQALEFPTVTYTSDVAVKIYHVYTDGKGDKLLELRFTESTAELFRRYLKKTRHVQSPKVFTATNYYAKPVSHHTINNAFKRVCKFAGTPVWLSHSIRKANVMAILDNSGDIKTAAGYAQHSDSTVTLRHYVTTTARRVDLAAATMEQRRFEEAQLMQEMAQLFKKSH